MADVEDSVLTTEYDGPYFASLLLGVTISLLVLSLLMVMLRFFVRARMVKNVGLDDWLLLPSLALTISIDGLVMASVAVELGGKVEDMSAHDLTNLIKYSAILRLLWIVSVYLVKLCLAVTLLRFANRTFFRYIVFALIISMTIINVVLLVLFSVSCRPYSASWALDDEGKAKGKCFSPKVMENLSWAFSTTDIIYNFALALLPVPMIWSVQMPKRMKRSVMAILGLGLIASVASIVRVHYMLVQEKETDIGEALAHTSPLVVLWTTLEIGLGITAACATACRPLLQRFCAMLDLSSSSPSHGPASRASRILTSRKMNRSVAQDADGDSTTDLTQNDAIGYPDATDMKVLRDCGISGCSDKSLDKMQEGAG